MIEKDILELFQDESEDLEVIEEGEWEQDYKYQHCTTVVKHTPSGEFWRINQSRTGSYHSDWDYTDPDARRVYPHEQVITQTIWKTAP